MSGSSLAIFSRERENEYMAPTAGASAISPLPVILKLLPLRFYTPHVPKRARPLARYIRLPTARRKMNEFQLATIDAYRHDEIMLSRF